MNPESQGQTRQETQLQRVDSSIWPSPMKEAANRSFKLRKCRRIKIAAGHAEAVSLVRIYRGAQRHLRSMALPFSRERAFPLEESRITDPSRRLNFDLEQVRECPSPINFISFAHQHHIRAALYGSLLSLAPWSGWMAETLLFTSLRSIRKTLRHDLTYCCLLRPCISVN